MWGLVNLAERDELMFASRPALVALSIWKNSSTNALFRTSVQLKVCLQIMQTS